VVALCVLSSAGYPIAQIPADSAQAIDHVRHLLDVGDYAQAENHARALVAQIESRGDSGPLEPAQALDVYVEALARNGRAGRQDTLTLAERAVEIKEQRFGQEHLETSSSLQNLGTVLFLRGEFGVALTILERALAIRLQSLHPNDSLIGDSLDNLAATQMRIESFEESRQALVKALAIRETRADSDPIRLARTLELMAWLNRYSGDYASAKAPLDRALAIRRQFSPDHPDLTTTIEVDGDLRWLGGDIAGADMAWSDGLALAKRTLGPEHPAVVALLRRKALAARAFGNLTERRRLLEQGVEIAERSLGPCDTELGALRSDLANALEYEGEYDKAEKLNQVALSLYERCVGPDHSLTATMVHNLAILSAEIGDFGEAERLHARAVNIWSQRLGPDHPYVARGLDAFAEVVDSHGDHERARGLYERALAIRRKAVGANHPDVAWTLTNLARVDANLGNVTRAFMEIKQAIDIYEQAGVADEPDHFAKLLALRGEVETRRGDYSLARTSFAEALSKREQIFGKGHPLTASSRAELAAADFAVGSYEEAQTGALDAERAGREHLRFTVRYLPERQALAYAETRPKGLDVTLSILASGHSGDPSGVLNNVIQSRSVILDEFAARGLSASVAKPELVGLSDSLLAARQRYANLMFRSVGEADPAVLKILDEARREKEDAERALAERSATIRNELARADYDLADVRRALAPRRALVSFVRYERTSVTPAKNSKLMRRVAPSYMAFVVRSDDATLAAVSIGSAANLDQLVAQWRAETTGVIRASSPDEAVKSYRAAGAALRERVWDPLRPYLNDVQTVFIVPDGTLNLVSFAALPVGQASYLIDRGPIIHYLAAERDLVADTASPSSGRGLLALGGAAFNDATLFARTSKPASPAAAKASPGAVLASVRSSSSDTLRAGCGSLQTMQFTPLAGTSREVRDVAALWMADSPAQVLEGRDASEQAFKREAPGHRVLHLATHGFFLGNDCTPAGAATRSVGALTTGQTKTVNRPSQPKRSSSVLSENPLLMSGLALAGANRRSAAGPNEDDGVLTAEEVSALSLEGVEWAVLSACDTGLGEVKAGEGVFGLRRAFQVAGVRTVIMSLWPVDDQATRIWMRALYQGRLQKRLSTADAMHQASLSVLENRRANHQSTHPFYWAAFVAAGDWR
jgi:CHAT domain-containing protein